MQHYDHTCPAPDLANAGPATVAVQYVHLMRWLKHTSKYRKFMPSICPKGTATLVVLLLTETLLILKRHVQFHMFTLFFPPRQSRCDKSIYNHTLAFYFLLGTSVSVWLNMKCEMCQQFTVMHWKHITFCRKMNVAESLIKKVMPKKSRFLSSLFSKLMARAELVYMWTGTMCVASKWNTSKIWNRSRNPKTPQMTELLQCTAILEIVALVLQAYIKFSFWKPAKNTNEIP